MQHNKLWEGHRIVLSEMRDKAVHRCWECRFLVVIEGQSEARLGCIVSIDSFARLHRRVPERIPLREVLGLAGRDGLQEILDRGQPDAQACGLFRPRFQGRKKP